MSSRWLKGSIIVFGNLEVAPINAIEVVLDGLVGLDVNFSRKLRMLSNKF